MCLQIDEIPSMILEVIKETKRYGHTFVRSVGRSDGQRENSIPSHKPPTNTVCGGYNDIAFLDGKILSIWVFVNMWSVMFFYNNIITPQTLHSIIAGIKGSKPS